MAKRENLDEWAAKFLGEEGEDVSDAVAAQWYTSSPGAAFVVLNKAAAEGKNVKIEISGDKAEVYCGNAEVEGSATNLAELIVQACYDCHNG